MRLLFVLLFGWSGVLGAQEAYKCREGSGYVIQNAPCREVVKMVVGANGVSGVSASERAQYREIKAAEAVRDQERESANDARRARLDAKAAECKRLDQEWDRISGGMSRSHHDYYKATQDERSRIMDRKNQLRC